MASTIETDKRLDIVRGYREELNLQLRQGRHRPAIRLLFELAHDFCPAFERHIMALDAAADSDTDEDFGETCRLHFDAMERYIVDDLAHADPAWLDEAMAMPQEDAGLGSDIPGLLQRAKQAAIYSSLAQRLPLVEAEGAVRRLGRGSNSFTLGPVSLAVYPGSIVGVIGHNGAGKTTLLRLLSGELRTHEGSVGFPAIASQMRKSSHATIRSRIAFVGDDLEKVRWRVRDYLMLTLLAMGNGQWEIEHKTRRTLHRYGLEHLANRRVSELSTGFRLRFEIARVLLTEPNLLVLDEPLANLDPEARETVLGDLKLLASWVLTPVGIVVTSQHIREIETISDDLVVLKNGGVVFAGPTADVHTRVTRQLYKVRTSDDAKASDIARALGAFGCETAQTETVMSMPKEVTAERLLAALAEAGLSIRYFEDLSGAAETLLLHGASDYTAEELPPP